MDTDILVRKARQGDREALVQLIMAQKSDYYRLAYVYMKNQEDALDAMEDMIVLLHENIHKLKNEEAFYSWSKTILANCCKNLLKRNKKVINLETIEEGVYEAEFGQQEERLELESHLERLSPKQQEVIRLRYFLDLDYETIAGIVKIPVGTVKSRISIGLKKLREGFGGEAE